jgi:tetratricopeptide (TPR) repeat protein
MAVAQGDWQQLLDQASRLRRMGRIDEAIMAYQRVLSINSDLPNAWYNLGWLQRHARAFDDALTSYQRALELGVADPAEVHLNRAVILSDCLHRPQDALREIRAALDKSPGFVPALLNLGNLREDLGDRRGAREAYERVLEIDSANGLALARLAGVSHTPKLDSTLAARLRAALENPHLVPAEQAGLGFALAGLLDAAGQYDEAFEAARFANLSSRAAGGGAANYDRGQQERSIDRIKATFSERVAVPPGDAHAPVFICGMFRSGSTLVERILGAHSRVATSGELDLVPMLVGRIPDYPESVANADTQTVSAWRDFYLGGLPVQPSADRLVTDKRPDNFLHIGLIKTIFPRAKIIHTCRNPLDNLLSLYFLSLDPGMAYALDLADAAHWYGQYKSLMARWKSLYPNDIFDVDYDELAFEPRPILKRLLGFLELPWEDSVLEFYRSPGAVKTASVWQVREPLHARSSGRWRNYERHLGALKEALGS